MPKQSALYRLYVDRLARCKSSDELLLLSREIASKSFKGQEKTALMLSCVFLAKHFDKQNKKAGVVNEVSPLDSPIEE